MSQVIRVPQNVYLRLELHAEGFDSPANVIEKLLNHYEATDSKELKTTSIQNVEKKRDTTKYLLKDHEYGKGKLVLAVIQDYVKCRPETTFDELIMAFPKHIQGSIGVVNKLVSVEERYENMRKKRHFMQDIISLKDIDVVASTEWDVSNIDSFIEQARSLGYNISASD